MGASVGAALPPVRRLVARLTGARLCFGKPIRTGERTVVPVATLRVVGGLGGGRGSDAPDAPADTEAERPGGGGGGGILEARPVGFIDIGPEGARFQPIRVSAPPSRRMLQAASLAGAVSLLQAARARHRSRALVPRDRVRRVGRAGPSPWPRRSLGR